MRWMEAEAASWLLPSREEDVPLIAAAPDMADTLRHVAVLARTAILHQAHTDKTGFVELAQETLEVVNAALRKAGL